MAGCRPGKALLMHKSISSEKPADFEPIRFTGWKEALEREKISPARRDLFRASVIRFLRSCKTGRVPASVRTIRIYLANGNERDREALRWFFRASSRAASDAGAVESTAIAKPVPLSDPSPRRDSLRSTVPPLAVSDQGGADWERDLIQAVRSRGFLWRTEETYRMWAARFAQFLRPKSPYAATAEDVGAFLTMLAVKLRSMPSTQKQALNAIVFLMQEALHRQLGDIPFQRTAARQRVPTVLTPEECQQVFAQLEGTTRLMAELMYGSGLRLLELLRLRVHHVDLARHQMRVFSGKGDKDRVTVLPERLVIPLREHLTRLQGLYEEDRAAGLPGVWLPEGLARKYANAGESWEWPRKWLCQRGGDSTFLGCYSD